jgi:hypothetical protein
MLAKLNPLQSAARTSPCRDASLDGCDGGIDRPFEFRTPAYAGSATSARTCVKARRSGVAEMRLSAAIRFAGSAEFSAAA